MDHSSSRLILHRRVRVQTTTRHVIVHYHVFKNAGSTIDSILMRNFGALWGSIEGPNPWGTLSSEAVLQYARDNPELKAISSHHARLPQPNCSDIIFHPLLFLRHPIDRVGSVYSFERRQPENSPNLGVKIAQARGLAGYVKWRLSDGNGAVIRNFHTVHLSGREKDMRKAVATDHDLQFAMQRISRLPVFGIVELFEDSISRIGDYLAEHFANFDASYAVVNKSPERKETIKERLEEIAESLGTDLYQELLDKNAMDMRLYNDALAIFQSRGLPRLPAPRQARIRLGANLEIA